MTSSSTLGNSSITVQFDLTRNIDGAAQAAFDQPGIAIAAATGDGGPGAVEFPASSPYVTAVGGTTLTTDSSARGYSETVWSQSANGCSSMFALPAWQRGTSCSTRSVPDVSFVADDPGIAGAQKLRAAVRGQR